MATKFGIVISMVNNETTAIKTRSKKVKHGTEETDNYEGRTNVYNMNNSLFR